MAATTWYCWKGQDLILQVRVQPRASRDEIASHRGECLRVRITAPPADGKANVHLRKFLAKTFQVSQSMVTVVSGTTSRDKRVCIHAPRHLLDGIIPAENGDLVV